MNSAVVVSQCGESYEGGGEKWQLYELEVASTNCTLCGSAAVDA